MGVDVAIPCAAIVLWMLLKVLDVLVPTALTTRMAVMPISASTNPYSTRDCPPCFAFRFRIVFPRHALKPTT